MLDMETNLILVNKRVENSLNGALNVYSWSLFAPKTDKILKKVQKLLIFRRKKFKQIVFCRQKSFLYSLINVRIR